MKNSENNNVKNTKFRFLGPERYYTVAGRQLDERTNDGTDNFVNVQGKDEKTTIGSVIAVGIVAVTITGLICFAVRPRIAEKLFSGVLTSAVYDEAEIITDDQSLSATLDEYLELTGVCPVVYTVYDEEWKSEYTDLQTYTLHKYADNFDDMQHFVVVCSIPENEAKLIGQGETVDAHYEVAAINGTSTNLFISEYDLKKICRLVSDDLKNGSEPSKALEGGFRYAIEEAGHKMHPYTFGNIRGLVKSFLPMLIVLFIFVVILAIVCMKFKKDKIALSESHSMNRKGRIATE